MSHLSGIFIRLTGLTVQITCSTVIIVVDAAKEIAVYIRDVCILNNNQSISL